MAQHEQPQSATDRAAQLGLGESLAGRLEHRLAQREGRRGEPEIERDLLQPLVQFFSSLSSSLSSRSDDPEQIGLVDEFGMNEGWRARVRHFLELLYTAYWRVEVSGLEHVPSDGRAMLVSNHSGGLPFDAFMISHCIERDHPAHRSVRPLMEDVFSTQPYFSILMSRYGMVRACQENGQRLLEADRLICVFPEGVKGVTKRYRDRYRLLRFGRGGFVKLARRTESMIVPVSVVGAEEIYPIVARPDRISRRLGLSLPPATLTFPWLGPLGLVPLPSKWYIDFGKPIDVAQLGVRSEHDDIAINSVKEQVRARIQWQIIERLKRRESIWRG
ncbi:MAG: lysophospholipid acyltransferase family protein [Candidatus Alcyoniella australis]|nr:lysophospholipid acyltransferase family protein [Candidatus Alcyoniella australis]